MVSVHDTNAVESREFFYRGCEEWNAWRASGSAPDRPCLNGVDLTRLAFEGWNFRNVDFCHAKLDGIHFEPGTTVTGASFRGASLRKSSFDRCAMTGADFTGCDAFQSLFCGVSLAGCIFTGTNLRNAMYTYVRDIESADLTYALNLSYPVGLPFATQQRRCQHDAVAWRCFYGALHPLRRARRSLMRQ